MVKGYTYPKRSAWCLVQCTCTFILYLGLDAHGGGGGGGGINVVCFKMGAKNGEIHLPPHNN